jgi:hypothetical protein
MANILTEQRLVDNNKRTLVKYVYNIDSASANVKLLNASNLAFALNTNGYIMTSNNDIKSNYRTTIKRIFGQAKANAYIKLQWRGDANSDIVTIPNGRFDFNFDPMGDGAVIKNPEANATGDILISAITPSSADTLTLFLDLRKDNRDYDAGQTADPVAFNRGRAAP